MAATARGAVLLAEGNVAEALPALRDACRRWYELGSGYDAAGTCVRLAEAYRAFGDAASADAELARAEAVYERLGVRRPMRELPNRLTRVSTRCSRSWPTDTPTAISVRRCLSATGRLPGT
jgi:hypothetical protein